MDRDRLNVKFSIITACFNSADTIGKTIESVQSQVGVEYEHIIIDGESRDNTARLVRREAPSAIFVSEPDHGIYDAMNKGVRRASGDVIAILNSDDYYAHERVLSDVSAALAQSDADAVFADVAFFDPKRPDRIIRRYRSDRFSPARIKHGIMPAHPGMFLRKSVYERFGLYSSEFPVAADFEFIARIFSNGGIRYKFHPQIAVMMLPGGASNNGFSAKRRIFSECLGACRSNGIAASSFTMLAKSPLKILDYIGTKNDLS